MRSTDCILLGLLIAALVVVPIAITTPEGSGHNTAGDGLEDVDRAEHPPSTQSDIDLVGLFGWGMIVFGGLFAVVLSSGVAYEAWQNHQE